MHLAYIHQHFATLDGSGGTRSYEQARRLVAAGHRVTMVCGQTERGYVARARGGAAPASESVSGIDVRRISVGYANHMGFAARLQSFGRFAIQATRLVARLDCDLVFATSTPLTVAIPGVRAAARRGVPFVFEVRDLWPELLVAMGALRNPVVVALARQLERWAYRHATRVVALAPGIAEGVASAGYPPEAIAVIPNACDLELFQPAPAGIDDPRFGPAGDAKLVFAGAHGRANGLDAVVEAARILGARGERGVRFVLIGDGGAKPALVERVRTLGLADWVSFVPLLEKRELARLLPRCDAGLMLLADVPAFYRGTSPNKFFDYIAAGLPVINNYPGWLAGLIEESSCGLVVPPGDPMRLADAAVWVRDHRALARAMGMRAREPAERRFDREVLAGQLTRLLEDVVAGAGGRS